MAWHKDIISFPRMKRTKSMVRFVFLFCSEQHVFDVDEFYLTATVLVHVRKHKYVWSNPRDLVLGDIPEPILHRTKCKLYKVYLEMIVLIGLLSTEFLIYEMQFLSKHKIVEWEINHNAGCCFIMSHDSICPSVSLV